MDPPHQMHLGSCPASDAARPRSRALAVTAIALALMAAAVPFIVRAAIAVLSVDATTPLDWVPMTFGPRRAYADFTRQFESGDVVVLSWPGCELGSPALDRLLEAATGRDAPRDAAGNPWFDAVATGSLALDNLVGPPLSLDRAAAVDRLRGMLVGPDGRTTCAVIGFTPAGVADRRRAVAWIRDVVHRTATIDDAALHMAGPVIDNVVVDGASTDSLNTFALPAGFVILALTWWSLRSFAYACLVFVVSLWCVGLTFLTLHACGDRMNPVLIVMPVLVLVLGVSGGIHLVNYLMESLAAGGIDGAAARAVRLGWLPCSLSAGTTAIGLASLVVSELEPIRVFGFHAAIGVMATLLAMFLVVPGIFERWPLPVRGGAAAPATGSPQPFAALVIRHARPLVAAFFGAMAVAALGLPHVRTSVRIDTLFAADSRVIRDYAWIERAIGPLVPIEVMVRFEDGHDLRAGARLDLVRAIEDRLGGLAHVSGVVSAAAFLPDMDDSGSMRSTALKAIAARRLAQSLSAVDDMKYVRTVDGGQLWRVTARVPALAEIDYGEFLDLVRAEVQPLVAAAGGGAKGISIACTGVMPLVHAIQNTLLRDLFSSFLSACLLITVVMMVVERGLLAGCVAMVSNVFPMILMFGLLGWSRRPLDIGSVMTASIALGMAIDGTLHFLTFFRRGLASGAAPPQAVHAAFAHCAAAMTQSTVVCGLGILVFALSSFAPTSRFAWMLALLMAAALAGDLVLLPAMLVGPLGRWFRPARGGSPTPPPACGR
jgi:predicted RND superfamily exporter protein